MGISAGTLKLIPLTLMGKHPAGRVITFGVQRVEGGYEDVISAMSAVRYPAHHLDVDEITYDALSPSYRGHRRIHQETLFKVLGFEQIESVDYFPAEKPTHQIDLNYPIPSELHGYYDLVYDGGCMEHCFNVAQVMANAIALLKPGGRVIHHAPMNREINHGFYQFSPTIFFDYYDANGFSELEMRIHFQLPEQESYFSYDPRRDSPLPFSFGFEEMYIFFSARKRMPVDKVVFPLQSRYIGSTAPDKKGSTSPRNMGRVLFKQWRHRFLQWLLGDHYIVYYRKSRYWIDKRRMRRRVERLKRDSIKL
jgi:SAM-dependent methyltransferase